MNVPLVSVVIITYNHGPYIKQCLEGVLMQKTNFPFEVIIGEDCSTDNTRKVIQEFESQFPGLIKPIYHQSNVGPTKNAYHFCYSRVRGKYIAICEGDDYWIDPYKLQKQVDYLEQNPSCVLCYHKCNYVNHQNEVLELAKPNDSVIEHTWDDFFQAHIPPMSAVFRNCIDEIPDEIFHVGGADKFLFGLLAKHGNIVNLGFVGATYRAHAGGVYSSRNTLGKFKHTIQTRQLMVKSSCFSKEQKKIIRRDLSKQKLSYMKYFIKKGQLLNFFKIALT